MNNCWKICDYCKKESETGNYPSLPKDLKSIKVELSQYNNRNFDLCPDCLEKLGLIKKDGKMVDISEPTIQDKFFSMVYEIAQMAASDLNR